MNQDEKIELDKYQLLRLYEFNGINQFDFIKYDGNNESSSHHLIRLKSGDWVPIMTRKGYDVITGERYYSIFSIEEEAPFRILSYKPYQIEVYKKRHQGLHKISKGTRIDKSSGLNNSDYNKIFYENLHNVSPNEILDYLEIIQSVGKDAYIDAINKYRMELMELIYGKKENSLEEYKEQMVEDNNIKKILTK